MPEEKKVDKLVKDLKVGDKLVIKKNKKPHPIIDEIRTEETEITIEDVKPTYVTLKYQTTKEYAKEHDGEATHEISFASMFLKDYFKKKDDKK